MNIGVDFDDVIVDTYDIYMAYAQKYTIEELGRDIDTKNDGRVGKIANAIELHKWNEKEDDVFWDKYTESILTRATIKLFAKEALDKLKEEGNKIIVITARWDRELERRITVETIKKYDLKIDKLIMGADNKGKVAKENDIDVFIDDDYNNCKSVYDEGIKTYIMDVRRNRGMADEDIERVYSWPHAYREITKFIKENNNKEEG